MMKRLATLILICSGGMSLLLVGGCASTSTPAPVVDRMLKLLQRQKVLVRVDVLLFHEEALTQLKTEVTALKTSAGAGARIEVAAFKERFGVTRKFLLYLAATREGTTCCPVTRGHGRLLRSSYCLTPFTLLGQS